MRRFSWGGRLLELQRKQVGVAHHKAESNGLAGETRQGRAVGAALWVLPVDALAEFVAKQERGFLEPKTGQRPARGVLNLDAHAPQR